MISRLEHKVRQLAPQEMGKGAPPVLYHRAVGVRNGTRMKGKRGDIEEMAREKGREHETNIELDISELQKRADTSYITSGMCPYVDEDCLPDIDLAESVQEKRKVCLICVERHYKRGGENE